MILSDLLTSIMLQNIIKLKVGPFGDNKNHSEKNQNEKLEQSYIAENCKGGGFGIFQHPF